MKHVHQSWLACVLCGVVLALCLGVAPPDSAPAPAPDSVEASLPELPAAMTPAAREQGWGSQRQDEMLARVRQGKPPVSIVFIGDSITQGWEDAGAEIWKRDFAPLGALQLGASGDRTEHVLWRLREAPLTPLEPRVIVLMIGTNNTATGRDSGEVIVRAIRLIVETLKQQCPAAHILVLDIPPRGLQMNPVRGVVVQINQALSQCNWPANVKFLQVGDRFVRGDGSIDPANMPDALHFSTKGYGMWSDSIRPAVAAILAPPIVAPPLPAPALPAPPLPAPTSSP